MIGMLIHVQVECSMIGAEQSVAKQQVEYNPGTKTYSAMFLSLTPGGTYNIAVCAISDGKISEAAIKDYALSMSFIYRCLHKLRILTIHTILYINHHNKHMFNRKSSYLLNFLF